MAGSPRVLVLRAPEGSDVHEFLAGAIRSGGLSGGLVIGIGGLSQAELGIFVPSEGAYKIIRLEPPSGAVLEVAPLVGNYVARGPEVSIHLHATLGTPNGAFAGHLIRGTVRPMLELFVVEVGAEAAGALMQRLTGPRQQTQR
ncbi:MAG: DUF296 domain-containing protein [Desulfurococcaceae archaeon]